MSNATAVKKGVFNVVSRMNDMGVALKNILSYDVPEIFFNYKL